MNKAQELKKLESLGIPIGVPFEIQELTGWYKVDIDNRQVLETTHGRANVPVPGIYQHLLDGTWHKR